MADTLALHRAVWYDETESLTSLLSASPVVGLEVKDHHGRTPLMLAVSVGHLPEDPEH